MLYLLRLADQSADRVISPRSELSAVCEATRRGSGEIFKPPTGRASWILCYRFGGRKKEKVLGRYPEISLNEASEIALRDRAESLSARACVQGRVLVCP